MKERPILFSGEMVRAILDGRKKMTRRIVKTGTRDDWNACPYGGIGDRLWVRETFFDHNFDGEKDVEMIEYRASEWERDGDGGGWSPSIFMPRWASRITLEITSVRVERLQEISEADAQAEGVEPVYFPHDGSTLHPHFHGFKNLWDKINGKRASWESNPWVWVIEFKRVEGER